MASRNLMMIVFILGVVGTGMLIGMNFQPGAWHAALNKPFFNPPNWLFAPVWTTLYVLIGIVGWRVFMFPERASLRGLWILQMVLNFAWTPVFFGAQQIGWAAVVIVGVTLSVLAFILRAMQVDRPSAMMFLPYLAWVLFASALNIAIWMMN